MWKLHSAHLHTHTYTNTLTFLHWETLSEHLYIYTFILSEHLYIGKHFQSKLLGRIGRHSDDFERWVWGVGVRVGVFRRALLFVMRVCLLYVMRVRRCYLLAD